MSVDHQRNGQTVLHEVEYVIDESAAGKESSKHLKARTGCLQSSESACDQGTM